MSTMAMAAPLRLALPRSIRTGATFDIEVGVSGEPPDELEAEIEVVASDGSTSTSRQRHRGSTNPDGEIVHYFKVRGPRVAGRCTVTVNAFVGGTLFTVTEITQAL